MVFVAASALACLAIVTEYLLSVATSSSLPPPQVPCSPQAQGTSLSHRGVTSLIMRDERSNPVSPLVVLVGGVAFAAAFIFFIVGAYKLRQYQRWQAFVRQVTP